MASHWTPLGDSPNDFSSLARQVELDEASITTSSQSFNSTSSRAGNDAEERLFSSPRDKTPVPRRHKRGTAASRMLKRSMGLLRRPRSAGEEPPMPLRDENAGADAVGQPAKSTLHRMQHKASRIFGSTSGSEARDGRSQDQSQQQQQQQQQQQRRQQQHQQQQQQLLQERQTSRTRGEQARSVLAGLSAVTERVKALSIVPKLPRSRKSRGTFAREGVRLESPDDLEVL